MYTGNEKFINNGIETDYSMLGFWQWTLSCIHESATRGSLAEYIVKLAMDHGGLDLNPGGKTGMEMYDLEGPIIPSTGEPARIEVKSTSYFRIIPVAGKVDTKVQQFGIQKRIAPDSSGDYPDGAPKQRNNDIYVFVVYNGKDEDANIFDLSLWDFYVMPTFELNQDSVYCDRTTISLRVVQERCRRLTFDEVAAAISSTCEAIPDL